jgi:uncharacterized protein (TIGR01244 family)
VIPSSVQRIDDSISISPQLAPSDMTSLAAAGFRSVINNRPDHEGGADQPTSAQMEAAASAAGLAYAFLPVSPSLQTPEQIDGFRRLLDTLEKPIVAFCRSGTRSGKLVRAAREAGA